MAIATIPPELLLQCLGHLGEADLLTASLVCRDWLGPCRDYYWGGRLWLNPMNKDANSLAALMGETTTVPRKIQVLVMDETKQFKDGYANQTASWQAHMLKIMSHFSTVYYISIGGLNLNRFPVEIRRHILPPAQVNGVLEILSLKVEHPEEATPFILNQPYAKFLTLGHIALASETDEDERGKTIHDGEGNDQERKPADQETKNASSDISPSTFRTGPVVRLGKLRHLCLNSGPQGITWSHIVPLLASGQLVDLQTLIVDCHDGEALGKLFRPIAPALRSLAIQFNCPGESSQLPLSLLGRIPEYTANSTLPNPGAHMDISDARSLTKLAFSLANYPEKEYALADTLTTISSAPPSVEHVFLNLGKETINTENHPAQSAVSQWEALDVALARLPKLKRITIVVVFIHRVFIDRASMIAWERVGRLTTVDKWQNNALGFAKAQLPACASKGLLELKHLKRKWAGSPFANYGPNFNVVDLVDSRPR
ncbi:hypothetical protein CMUS01_12314 [Colletotrichum musicola]|uniref:F-box domain-containing protein n=1 Tax=Colletotrichum musicola TaxID=2175873 RepID=A0A8H6JNI8_9PEZI|nr:hypothetical protein CMUS01_12314 [Colletotrichum musicola]